MRGEFSQVWHDTYREIWTPLLTESEVPLDVYSELYRELAQSISFNPESVILSDAIELRELFERSIQTASVQVALSELRRRFSDAGILDISTPFERELALIALLQSFIHDEPTLSSVFARTKRELATDGTRQAEAIARRIDAIVNDPDSSRQAFDNVRPSDFIGERHLALFFERAFDVLEDHGGDSLSNSYFNHLHAFIEKYSLRYDLRRPCLLCPTVPGMFATLVRDLRKSTSGNAHLSALLNEFENAVRDLRADCSDSRIKTCIQKQVNLLEAIGAAHTNVTAKELGGMCDQISSWPHAALRASLKNLYGFASDYPGIRHGGNPAAAVRSIDLRDLIAVSIVLTGFTTYLSNALDPEVLYSGG